MHTMRFLNERPRQHTGNYFKPNAYLVSATRVPCMGNRQTAGEMSRNKSIIRSSSSGSYPYPRTHTTLMVIPSNRPPPPSQPVKMFTGVRRRPPLNRACPPIPESKSNESIMSHASRVSEHQKAATSDQTGDLVIENRAAVDVFHRLDTNSNRLAANPNETNQKGKKLKKMTSSQPKSPLMSMASSVKSKLTRITSLGRSSDSSSSRIKTSQSFSGIQKSQPKSVPKRIDQNANRVIKSSSMEVPSTSKVCIPQDPTPLIDDKIEEISEEGLISRSEMAPPKPVQHVCIKLEEDVLVVTKEFDELYPGQKRSASPDAPMVEESPTSVEVEPIPSEPIEELDNNGNQKTPAPIRKIIPEVVEDEEIQYTTLETVKFAEIKEKVTVQTDEVPETKEAEKTVEKVVEKEKPVAASEHRDEEEDVMPQPKYVIVMKTPECLRRHHTFTIGDRPKSPDYPFIEEGELTEPIATVGPPADRRKKEEEKERKRKEWEEYEKPKEKYILTTTTPLAIRKYQTFVVEARNETVGPIPQSASADPVKKNPKIQRSESTDSKKHSYLRRLQFELFRGRSRERKSEKTEKRQKSLDERTPASAQKYVLSTTTPVMMRKYQTFAIVESDKSDKKTIDKNIESIASAYQKTEEEEEHTMASPIRTSDFYSITATTPVAKRKAGGEESVTSSSPRQLSIEEVKPISPEPRHLFVMGGRRSTTPKDERRADLKHLKLDASTADKSQSDKAELLEERKSTMSGDLTSPEEEIPMDTNLTPTSEEVVIVSRRIEGLMTSPIEEEPEGSLSVASERPAPVFTPPSPPKDRPFPMMSQSTSTSSSEPTSSRTKPTLPMLPIKSIQVVDPMHVVELKAEHKEHKSKKEALASKSLRNAGKMLTPSFLRKDKKAKAPKKPLYPKTTSTGRQHISEKFERKAPLAEGESSVVANSPLVENLPITFEKWSHKSPRLSAKQHLSETIVEEGLDANANATSPQLEHRLITTTQTGAVHDNTGLIDDDIIDQPMLVGDTFSHSSSIDCLSAHQKMNESIISIDRSIVLPESRSSNNGTAHHQNQQNRNISSFEQQIDAGRSEVQDIKSQLEKLNRLVNEMGISGWEEELARLRRENEQLRRELAERDATIAALQSQTVSS